MPQLVLLRHGQSLWNAENLFTGWFDVDLTAQGEDEARAAGALLAADPELDLRVVHTSLLTRAIRTANLTLDVAGRSWLPVQSPLAAQRAALRRTPGTRQEGDHGQARRRPGEGVAPQLRHPATAGRAGGHPRSVGRPPVPRRARRRAAAHRMPGRRRRPNRAVLGRCHRARPAGRRAPGRGRPGRGPRQQPAGPAQAHRGHRRRRTSSTSRSPRGSPTVTSWPTTCRWCRTASWAIPPRPRRPPKSSASRPADSCATGCAGRRGTERQDPGRDEWPT